MPARFEQLSQLKWLRVVALGVGIFLCTSSSLGAPPTLEAKLVCQTLPQVVLCAIHLEPSPGAVLKWAEATIIEAPAFVRPVRSKVTYKENPVRGPSMYLGLTPTGRGKGELAVMARTVVCSIDGAEGCAHLSRRLQATITVSSASAR